MAIITGTEGDDTLTDQRGSDTIDGLGGNDTITSYDGLDRIFGGTGNDSIYIRRVNGGTGTVTLDGGAGDDRISVDDIGGYHATIDLGDGNDRLEFISGFKLGNADIAMGAGQDLLVLTRPGFGGNVTISDFQVGDNGDRLEFLGFDEPLQFIQQGANTLVVQTRFNYTETMLTLLNVQASQLSNYNMGATIGTSGPDQISGGNWTDTIYGLDGDDRLYGKGGDDKLYGDGGSDLLDGGAGNDRMEGGSGNDLYYVADAGDIIVEAVGGGNDGVYSYVSYVLTAGAEVETLSTISHSATTEINLTGNSFNQNVIGNAGANILHGGGGVDALYGFGGNDVLYGNGNDALDGGADNDILFGNAGANQLRGGTGNDIYFVDDPAGLAFEAVGAGNDAVYVGASYALLGGQEIETLSTDYFSTSAINLTGNGFNQVVAGNSGNNVLHGGGGTDQLWGFGGNDTYYTDVAATKVIEATGDGNDALYTSVSYVLAGGDAEVELLSVNSHAAISAINLTGNHFNQIVVGNNGNNILHGGGGADVLYGMGGNDVFYTDVAATQVVEAVGGGNDALYTSVSYTLAAGAAVELLSANATAATSAINLTGNSFANVVAGNAGANRLNGGAGADTLYGFGGADSFGVTTPVGGGNVDVLADFVAGDDTIRLDDAIFAGIGTPNYFSFDAFVVGATAADANDRIVYNQATGQLFYDADGNGAGAAVLFATLAGAPVLTAIDFVVI